MRDMRSTGKRDYEDPIQASFEEGMLGDEYELVGLYRDGSDHDPDDASDFDYEIFIMSVGTEV